MKYDDASWHYGGDNFPKGLPPEAGATHTGMFLVWALLQGLGGDIHIHDFPENLPSLEQRKITPGVFFLTACDGKFWDEDLNAQGNAFTAEYFDFERGAYLGDYDAALGSNLPELYYVADTWQNFDKLRPTLDRRYEEWLAKTAKHSS